MDRINNLCLFFLIPTVAVLMTSVVLDLTSPHSPSVWSDSGWVEEIQVSELVCSFCLESCVEAPCWVASLVLNTGCVVPDVFPVSVSEITRDKYTETVVDIYLGMPRRSSCR